MWGGRLAPSGLLARIRGCLRGTPFAPRLQSAGLTLPLFLRVNYSGHVGHLGRRGWGGGEGGGGDGGGGGRDNDRVR